MLLVVQVKPCLDDGLVGPSMCPFHESSRRSDGSVLDDGKDDKTSEESERGQLLIIHLAE